MRAYGRRRQCRPGDLITASELASYAFCPEAWRLEYGLGLAAENQAALAAGARHHARKAAAERVAGWSMWAGRILLIAGLVSLLLWMLMR